MESRFQIICIRVKLNYILQTNDIVMCLRFIVFTVHYSVYFTFYNFCMFSFGFSNWFSDYINVWNHIKCSWVDIVVGLLFTLFCVSWTQWIYRIFSHQSSKSWCSLNLSLCIPHRRILLNIIYYLVKHSSKHSQSLENRNGNHFVDIFNSISIFSNTGIKQMGYSHQKERILQNTTINFIFIV